VRLQTGGGAVTRAKGLRQFRHIPIFFVAAAVVVACGCLIVCTACRAEEPPDLRKAIDELLSSKHLVGARFGVRVIEVPSGRVVYSIRAREPLCVASNMKLATLAAALEMLGPDYVYDTRVYCDGDISRGQVEGNLYIIGAADPTLSARFHEGRWTGPFERWAQALYEAGLRQVTGGIVADASLFDSEYRHPSWPEGQYLAHYCAEVSALSLNDNVVGIDVVPAGDGTAPRLSILPPTSFVQVTHDIRPTSSKKKHKYAFYRTRQSNEIRAQGSYWTGAAPSRTRVTIHDPASYTATVFAECLERHGITVTASVRVAEDPVVTSGKRLLVSYRSRLADSVGVMLTKSVNLYAEMLFKLLGAKNSGRGSFAAGAAAVRQQLEKIIPNSGAIRIVDGSGLSRENRLSPYVLTEILAHAYRGRHRDLWLKSLARSGRPGTLSKRMREPWLAGKVAAKTGYISGTCALSGYCFSGDGRVYAFSFVVNDFKSLHETRKLQDALCGLLVGHPR